MVVKLVATVKSLADAAQKERLLATMRRFNEACAWLAGEAFAAQSADKYKLQRAHYRELRERFGLSAQHAVRAIAKVSEVYKRDKTKRPAFKPLGAVPYDQRLYTFKGGLDRLSLLALDGRMVVPVAIGPYHRGRLDGARGQADLVCRKGKLYLYVTVEGPDGSPVEPEGWLGVDLGIRNLATDSDGEHHTGAGVEAVRERYGSLRGRLQAVGTKSARRHLKKLAGKEARFRHIESHRIAKRLVAKAKDTARGLALEELGGIRERVTVRGPKQRARLHGWSFFQSRQFVAYKAASAGVPVVVVDPRDTSRTCLECGAVDKASRRSQAEFRCTSCGFESHADVVGARNIRRRAEVIRPMVSGYREGSHRLPLSAQEQSPCLAARAAGGG